MSERKPLSTLDIARLYVQAGLSVIPIQVDGTKRPSFALLPYVADERDPSRSKATWTPYQSEFATDTELLQWFGGSSPAAIAIVGGAVSGGAECIDVDEPALIPELLAEIERVAPGLRERLVHVETGRGGAHLWYRCAEIDGNLELASRHTTEDERAESLKAGKTPQKTKTLIETRGEGGYAVAPGSPAKTHESGRPYRHLAGRLDKIQEIAVEERATLLGLCRAYNQVARTVDKDPAQKKNGTGVSPWDDFDARGPSFEELLANTGARLESGTWEYGKLVRPGKDRGVGATVGICRGEERGEPLLHVFTSSWHPFVQGKSYGKFNVLRWVRHDGDFNAALKDVLARGFGEQRRRQTNGQATNGQHNGQAASSDKPPDEGITARHLMTVTLPDPVVIVDGLILEGLNLLAGRPKSGKSWAALNIGMAVADGGTALGGLKATAGDVLYLALEDNRRRLKRRLTKMLGDMQEAPERLDFRCQWHRLDKGGFAHIREWLTGHPGAKLIIIDTLAKVRAGRKGNGNVYDEDYEALAGLQGLAMEFHVAFLIVHHTRKADAEDVFDTVSGSLAITGAADTIVVLKRQRGTDSATLHVTGRDIEDKELVLKWIGQSGLWQLEGDAANLPPVLIGLAKEIHDLLTRTDRSFKPSEAASALGKEHGAVKTTMWRMEGQGILTVDHGRYRIAGRPEAERMIPK